MTVQRLTWHLVLLTALRWLPVGVTVPVMVLLAQERGLSLADVGLLFAVYGVLVACLELPTGGLADVLGRRAVALTASGLHVLACLLVVVADGMTGFLLAFAVKGLGRAMDSGPVEAWYVDSVHALHPGADVAPGLSRQLAADGAGLAVGAVVGGLLSTLTGSLATPFYVAAALDVLFVVAALRVMTESRPPRAGTARSALAAGVREVPATVVAALRLSATDRGLRLVLLLTAVSGVGIVAFELLGPGRFAALAGSPERGAAVFGTVSAVAFALAAAASLLGAPLRRALRGSTAAACALVAVAGSAGLAGFEAAGAVLAAAVALTVFYVASDVQWPLLSAVLHARVGSAHRSTAMSARSLALMTGGLTGNLLLPRLDRPFLWAAGLVLVSALVCLRLPEPSRTRPAPDPAPPLTTGA